ncbi:MAG: protein kinase [Candidatus Riflebacteria bacterium]|nr:protein kinase [Candidatus Riflebacteria bacterium]
MTLVSEHRGPLVCSVCREQFPSPMADTLFQMPASTRGRAAPPVDDAAPTWSRQEIPRIDPQVQRVQAPAPDRATLAAAAGAIPRPSPPPSDRPGSPFSEELLRHYEQVRFLGKGAKGEVYLMRQLKLGRLVAVKMLREEAVTADDARRLLKEARVLASLNHPNILALYDVGTETAQPYMVSEYVGDETLADRMARRPPLTLPETIQLVMQILEGLTAAHQQGIVHRDLKPSNVFLTASGRPKIGDFGLAKWEGLPSATASTGKILGTPAYMSPEQCRGRPTTPASDLYAVGVILFEMVVGTRPFPGPDLVEFLDQHVNRDAPKLRTLKPAVPEVLEAIVAKALEKDPAARFGSAQEFRQALIGVERNLIVSGDSRRVSVPGATRDETPREGHLLIDRYQLVRLVSDTQLGQVWIAQDQARESETVTIKLVPPELWADPTTRSRFVVETNSWLRMAHPNIVRAIHLEAGKWPFLVVERAGGQTLAEELAQRGPGGKGPMTPDEVLVVLEGLVGALEYAHRRELWHGDVRPATIIFDASGGQTVVKLTDFAVNCELAAFARLKSGSWPAQAAPYTSPEQLEGRRPGVRSDVFGLGACAHEMLTLKTAPRSSSMDRPALVDLERLASPVAPAVARALSPRPEDRQESPLTFLKEYRQTIAPRSRSVVVEPAPVPPAEHEETPRPPARSANTAPIGLGLALLICGGVFVAAMGRRPEPTPPGPRPPLVSLSPLSMPPPTSPASLGAQPPGLEGGSTGRRDGPTPEASWLPARPSAQPGADPPVRPTVPTVPARSAPAPVPTVAWSPRFVQTAPPWPPSAPTAVPVPPSGPSPGSLVGPSPPAPAPATPSPGRPAVGVSSTPVRVLSVDERRLRDDAVSRGDALYKQGLFSEALLAYHEAQDLDPDHPAVLRKVALCRTKANQMPQALKAISRAAVLDPTNTTILNTYSVILRRAGHRQRSVEVALRAVELRQDDANLWDTLGHAYLSVGRKPDAKKAFVKALELDPEYRTAKEGLAAAGR